MAGRRGRARGGHQVSEDLLEGSEADRAEHRRLRELLDPRHLKQTEVMRAKWLKGPPHLLRGSRLEQGIQVRGKNGGNGAKSQDSWEIAGLFTANETSGWPIIWKLAIEAIESDARDARLTSSPALCPKESCGGDAGAVTRLQPGATLARSLQRCSMALANQKYVCAQLKRRAGSNK